MMTVMQRMGNKKVTLVENLEFYGIPSDKLAHTAQKLAAASTTGMYFSSIIYAVSMQSVEFRI